jgi:Protein of unknown function (DUF2726)
VRIVDAFLNKSEEVAFRELVSIANDNEFRVFAKTRLSDVLDKGSSHLTNREFEFYTKSHFDFILTDKSNRLVFAVEFDGPMHTDEKQAQRDRIKNDFCKDAGLGLLRINDRHLSEYYRGMTLLRWIVEVLELQKWFNKAQTEGSIPLDEPFDPMLLGSVDSKTRFPYWLSAPATQQIQSYLRKLDKSQPKGWSSLIGHDENGTQYQLSHLYFSGGVLYKQTAVRAQDIEGFPQWELLNEVGTYALGNKLLEFRQGRIQPTSVDDFNQIFKNFCAKYHATPSHSSGSSAVNGKWNHHEGWRFP